MQGVCPSCGYCEEEPFDFDLQGNDLYLCGQCGIKYSQTEEGDTLIVDVAPGTA